MEMDEILPMVGERGKFQIILETILCLMEFPNGLLVMMPYFTQDTPAWECVSNSSICQLNGTFSLGQDGYDLRCNMPRNEWQFTRPKEHSIITEFDLYCDTEFYGILASSLPFLTWGVGGAVLGWIVDRFGRKRTILFSSAMTIIVGLITSFSPNLAFYIVMRAIIGFFIPASFALKIVYICEFVGTNYRPYFTVPFGIIFGSCAVILSFLAYFIRGWRDLSIACTAPYIATIAGYWYIPESIRWLRVKGKMEEVHSTLKRMATMNGKEDLPENIIGKIDNRKVDDSSQDSSLTFILDLFRPRAIAIRNFIHGYAWIVCGLVYYGVAFAADDLGGMKYRDFALASFSDVAGTIACLYVLRRFGRKKPVILAFLIGGISCIAVSLLPSRTADNKRNAVTEFRVALGMVGKFCISICFTGVYLWSTEAFPTVMRGIGMGYLQIAARIGSASAPWVAKGLKTVDRVLPFALMGASSVVCAGMLLLVPDTADKATLETREDMLAGAKVNQVITEEELLDKI